MSSRIEQLIDEIETYIDNCKSSPLSKTNIIVNKEEIDDLLRELRNKTPEEIKRYQKIINNKEAILNDAKAKAQDLINKATQQTTQLISDHEIMQQAYAQANEVISQAARQAQEILDRATEEANQMRSAAVQYTDDLLSDVDNILNQAIDTTNSHNESIITALTSYSETIKSNRSALIPPTPEAAPSVNPQGVQAAQVSEPPKKEDDDTLNLDLL